MLTLTCPISIFKELRRSDFILHFQGYIRYKTIASQNMPFEAPVKDFFVSKESYVPFSGYSSFCIFNRTMICKIYDVMMSINTCDRVRFWIFILSLNSLTHETWSIDKYKQGQYFSEIFWTIWRTRAKFQTLLNLVPYSNYSITNYVKFPVFHFFERVNKGESRMITINY